MAAQFDSALWDVLATKFGDLFVKTELVLRNPERLPGVETWSAVADGYSAPPVRHRPWQALV